jgi:hypothetical protein
MRFPDTLYRSDGKKHFRTTARTTWPYRQETFGLSGASIQVARAFPGTNLIVFSDLQPMAGWFLLV